MRFRVRATVDLLVEAETADDAQSRARWNITEMLADVFEVDRVKVKATAEVTT